MKMNKIILGTASVLLVLFVSCAKFENYESKQLASAPTLKIAREEIMDSSVVVSFTSSTTGFLSFALFEGKGNPTPDSSALIQLNVNAMQMGSGELTVANQPVWVEMNGLKQNTNYELFAVSQNNDGVLSKVTNALLITTTDKHGPELSDIDPAVSTDDEQSTDFQIFLSFDEPISTADAGKFIFTYFLEGADAVASSAIVNPDDPYQVIVSQSREAHSGDYVFLSFSDGAVEDIVGNKVGSFESGVDDTGAPFGLYWRTARVGWDIDLESVNPAAGTTISDPEFTIEFKTTVATKNKVADGSVRLIVVNENVTSIYKVLAENVILADDEETVTITKPFTPISGDSIYLEIDAGAFTDNYGNPNNVIESGKDGINPDYNSVTEIGWVLSY